MTEGWAVTYRLPTPAEAARKVWPTTATPWFWWPVDLLAGAFTLALIFLAYLVVNAHGTVRRRRAGLLLFTAVVATVVVSNLIT
ncbi:hypothetical protein I0C86_40690 [Plantactinospora sp. S1510]|uniref:Uncharacterized protein n=1 Tax=Plantactinospora alkalitolerans TaxID=2789879 RepID=A0ABS0H9N9_9ACTN|nr:hypothetical protein [Plantactinospora alkalitolerans]MBF9135199.1 hypothetical protein [Plantactinospora alkalitolerans]